MINNNTKEKLMRQIQVYSFAVYDALLYLDAYPNSKEALNHYNKYKRLEKRAMQEYEQRFGPLVMPEEATEWCWTNGPWPWQIEKGGR